MADESRLLAEETREETLERTEDKREEMLEVGLTPLLEEEAERGSYQSTYLKVKREERGRTTAERSLETHGLLNLFRGTGGLETLKDGLLILGVHADAGTVRAVRGGDNQHWRRRKRGNLQVTSRSIRRTVEDTRRQTRGWDRARRGGDGRVLGVRRSGEENGEGDFLGEHIIREAEGLQVGRGDGG